MEQVEQNIITGRSVSPENTQIGGNRSIEIFICCNNLEFENEINVLNKEVVPQIRKICMERLGAEFRLLDLHFLSDLVAQNMLSRVEMEKIRIYELARCLSGMGTPKVLIMVGHRYGEFSIPLSFSEDEFETIKGSLEKQTFFSSKWLPVIEDVYQLNNNYVPPNYVLDERKLALLDQDLKNKTEFIGNHRKTDGRNLVWNILYKSLQNFEENEINEDFKLQNILSEFGKEICASIFATSKRKNDRNGEILLFYRNLADYRYHVSLPGAEKHMEVYSTKSGERFLNTFKEELLGQINDKWTRPNISPDYQLEMETLWRGSDGIDPQTEMHQTYLLNFKNLFLEKFGSVFDSQTPWDFSPKQLLVDEIKATIDFCFNEGRNFSDYNKNVEFIRNYIYVQDSQPLIVHGKHGSGKTALLASACAQIIQTHDFSVIPVFYGITRGGLSSEILLNRIGQQISIIEDSNHELWNIFGDCPPHPPLTKNSVIFLDSVDFMIDDESFSKWLRSGFLANIKVIISVNESRLSKLTEILGTSVPNDLCLDEMTVDDSFDFISRTWNMSSVVLTESQSDTLKKQLESTERTPLLLSLVCQEYLMSGISDGRITLPQSTETMINNRLQKLEDRFGRLTISTIILNLLSVTVGLSNAEMEDLLSLSDEVLDELYGDVKPAVRRFPSILWSAIRLSLEKFLVSFNSLNVAVNRIKHQVITLVCRKRYSNDENLLKSVFENLSEYFSGVGSPDSSDGDKNKRFISQQNFKNPSNKLFLNWRRNEELPNALKNANRFAELEKLVSFNFDWFTAKLMTAPSSQLLGDIRLCELAECDLLCNSVLKSFKETNGNANYFRNELISKLLPFISESGRIRKIIDLIDRMSCGLVPLFSHSCEQDNYLNKIIDTEIVPQKLSINSKEIMIKATNSPDIILHGIESGKTEKITTARGNFHATTDGERILIFDKTIGNAISVFSRNGKFLGFLIPSKYITPKLQKHVLEIMFVGQNLVVIQVIGKDNFLAVADVTECKFLRIIPISIKLNKCYLVDENFICGCSENSLAKISLNQLAVVYLETDYMIKYSYFSEDGKYLLVLSSDESFVDLASLEDLTFVNRINLSQFSYILEISLTKGNKYLILTTPKKLHVICQQSVELIYQIQVPKNLPKRFSFPDLDEVSLAISNLTLLADSELFAFSYFCYVFVVHTASGKIMHTLRSPLGQITDIYKIEDYKLAIKLKNQKFLVLFDLNSLGKPFKLTPQLYEPVNHLKVFGNKVVVSWENGKVLGVLSKCSGKYSNIISHPEIVDDYVLSVNKDILLVSTKSRKIYIWNLITGGVVRQFSNYEGFLVAANTQNCVMVVGKRPEDEYYSILNFTHENGEFDSTKTETPLHELATCPIIRCKDNYLVFTLPVKENDHIISIYDLQKEKWLRLCLKDFRLNYSDDLSVECRDYREDDVILIHGIYQSSGKIVFYDVSQDYVLSCVEHVGSIDFEKSFVDPENSLFVTENSKILLSDGSTAFEELGVHFVGFSENKGTAVFVSGYEIFSISTCDWKIVGKVKLGGEIKCATISRDDCVLLGLNNGNVGCLKITDSQNGELSRSLSVESVLPQYNSILHEVPSTTSEYDTLLQKLSFGGKRKPVDEGVRMNKENLEKLTNIAIRVNSLQIKN